jgi:hypothetical protein
MDSKIDFFLISKKMTWTVVGSTMKHGSTSESVLDELNKKIAKLAESGWICVGDTVYHTNAVSQIMIPIATSGCDVARMRPEWDKHWASGSFVPKDLTYAMGNAGNFGVHTKFDETTQTYYDY